MISMRLAAPGVSSQTFQLHQLLKLAFLCYMLFTINSAFAERSLVDSITAALAKRPAGATVALSVLKIANGTTEEVLHYNADQALTPASVQKLVTTAVALRTLGPEFRFRTEIFGVGGRSGNYQTLFLVGGGDPSLAIEHSYLMAKALFRRGVRKVDQLILNSSKFVGRAPQGTRAYDAGLSPLSFNFNSMFFEICPGAAAGSPAVVGVDVADDFAQVINKVVTGKDRPISIDASGDGRRFVVSGAIRPGSVCKGFYRAVGDPAVYFAHTFANQLQELGISVGEVRVSGEAQPNSGESHLYTHLSRPLAEILHAMNRFSTNTFADHLVYALSDKGPDSSWSWGEGLSRLLTFASQSPYLCASCEFRDGSGLAHSNKMTSRFLGRLLAEIALNPALSADFQAGLPAPGRTGSLEDRLASFGSVNFRAKTGTLTGVRSLAGYVYPENGQVYAFALLQNNLNSREDGFKFEEAVVKALGARYPDGKSTKGS